MDTGRAEEVLVEWLNIAIPIDRTGTNTSHFVQPSNSALTPLLAQEDQVRRIAAQLLGSSSLPDVIQRTQSFVSLKAGIDTVRYALARLRTDAETRKILGPTAPTMAADSLHPAIWLAASGLWDDGHYGQAVQRAATALNGHVQDKVNRHDVSDSVLMTEVFSDKDAQPGKARLRWPGADDDQTVRSIRAGHRMVAPGVYLAVRNPATHLTDELGRQDALERLATLSMVARWVDACDVLKVS